MSLGKKMYKMEIQLMMDVCSKHDVEITKT